MFLIHCLSHYSEVELVEKVTSAILKAYPTPTPLAFARHLVGLKESLAHVVGMLHKMGDTIGVFGHTWHGRNRKDDPC